MGICVYSVKRAFVTLRLGEKVWLTTDLSSLFQRCSVGLMEFLHAKFVKPCFCGARFVHMGKVMLEQEGAFPELATKLEVYCVKCLCKLTLTLSPNPEKQA